MVQTLLKLEEAEDRVVNIVKGVHGLKNKNEAIKQIIHEYEKNLLERPFKEEYIKKIQKLRKGPKKRYASMKELWDDLEGDD